MAPQELPSNIRVFVRWHEPTVFAGEEIRCTIIFRNVSQTLREALGRPATQQHHQHQQHSRPGSSQVFPLHRKASAGLASPPLPPAAAASRNLAHRSAQSLSVPQPIGSRSRLQSGSTTATAAAWQPGALVESPAHARGHVHNGSPSLVPARTIGAAGAAGAGTRDELASASAPRPHRPHRGHGRATSLQIPAKRASTVPEGPLTAGVLTPRHTSSPLFRPSSPDRGTRSLGPTTPVVSEPQGLGLSDFRFPLGKTPPPAADYSQHVHGQDHFGRLTANDEPSLAVRCRSRDPSIPTINEHTVTLPAKIISSSTFAAGTPRSSGEFYSLSNNSSETLVSEYVTQQPTRGQARPPHLRRISNLSPQHAKLPEALMMGYAQVQGSFVLDGSLVSLSPFEDVKKKAAFGGQGGGVIGIESSKRENGLLRGFGWSNIGSSLGELLGSSELSTIKEMRGLAGSKSVPLLSSPQSILFVDLHLAPGQSKCFEYAFRLPRGLPPSHKGKAIKISYGLVIGTQRPGGSREQQVRSAEVPFRVLSSVNSHGELLGHDLMSPYVLLRDQARATALSSSKSSSGRNTGEDGELSETMDDFVAYAETLLDRRRRGSNAALLSPTAMLSRRQSSVFGEPTTANEAINLAILRSNLTSEGQQSPNQFEIARNGLRVAVVMLTRPAYRLGEVISVAIDFAGAEVATYAVHCTLESSERIEPSLAMRSEASVHRVTRKIHASSSEATLFSRRAIFTPNIPITATPEFVTSGVSLEWKVWVEFVVPTAVADAHGTDMRTPDEHQRRGSSSATPTGVARPPSALLEQISRDEKGGTVLVAVENLECESFEVPVPIRVYGVVGAGLERLDRDDALDNGLAV